LYVLGTKENGSVSQGEPAAVPLATRHYLGLNSWLRGETSVRVSVVVQLHLVINTFYRWKPEASEQNSAKFRTWLLTLKHSRIRKVECANSASLECEEPRK
jgi:hypothetical protein